LDEKSGAFCIFDERVMKRSYFQEKKVNLNQQKNTRKIKILPQNNKQKTTETNMCHQSKSRRDPETD
jgi:hypothetical protein